MLSPRLSLLAFATLACLTSHVSTAGSIDTLPTSPPGAPTRGLNRGFVAQSFELAGASRLDDFSFLVHTSSSNYASTFRVLVTDIETGTSAGFHPTNVLFESETFSLPAQTRLQLYTVSLGQTFLDAGRYAIVIDGYTTNNQAALYYRTAQSDSYPDGSLNFLSVSNSATGGSRSDYFVASAPWTATGVDLAFRLQFTPAAVPEPSSLIAAVSAAIILAGVAMRRRGAM